MVFQTPPAAAAPIVMSGTACVIGRTTTTIKTPNGVECQTTFGCIITTVCGDGKFVKKTGRDITSATSQAIKATGGWSKERAVGMKESVRTAWRHVAGKVARKSKNLPKPKSKELLKSIIDKAMNLRRKLKKEHQRDDSLNFGEGGVWQRTIIMGEKCQPLDFSGVIYYDNKGHQMSEVPKKSPRRFPCQNLSELYKKS